MCSPGRPFRKGQRSGTSQAYENGWPFWGPISFRTPTRTGSEIPDPSWELRKRGHLNSTKSPEWGPFQMIFYYHNRPDLYKSDVTRSARHEDGFAQPKPVPWTPRKFGLTKQALHACFVIPNIEIAILIATCYARFYDA